MKVLADNDYVCRLDFKMPGRPAQAYCLTERGRSCFPSVRERIEPAALDVSANGSRRGFQRVEAWIHANVPGTERWVGQSKKAREAFAKFYGLEVPENGVLPYDIVLGIGRREHRPRLFVVDDLDLDVGEVVARLPIHAGNGHPFELYLLPNDFSSVWETKYQRWRASNRLAGLRSALHKVPRVRLLESAFYCGHSALVSE